MITIGIGELDVCKSPDFLATFALGSCVGVCLFDTNAKVVGLSHVMLPKAPAGEYSDKYADVAIYDLIHEMERCGASKFHLKAKIAGGAQMFVASNASSVSNIGEKNVNAVTTILRQLNIPIVASDTGKDYARTIYFYPEDYRVEVKSCKGIPKTL